MLIIKPVDLKDEEAFIRFARSVTFGMTSIPKSQLLLREKLIHSYDCFCHKTVDPHHQTYLFGLYDLEQNQLDGISAIIAHSDLHHYYHLDTSYTHSKNDHVPEKVHLLTPVSYDDSSTEIASLYVEPKHRKGGFGRLLSLSRFLYMAARPDAFEKVIMSRLRGVFSQDHRSSFWDALGHHFYQVSIQEVLRELSIDYSMIPHIMPEHPVYVALLPPEAQEVIGQPDSLSKPAFTMLIKEGFAFNGDIDIIDGGPRIVSPFSNVRAIRESVVAEVTDILDKLETPPEYIVSNNRTDIHFRACYTALKIQDGQKVILPRETADALNIALGDKIRFIIKEPS
jgi:arginine N-succinyltransferase